MLIAPHPKIAHHSRYILRLTVRMSNEGVLQCTLLIADGKFLCPLPDGKSYRDMIAAELRVSAETWAI